MSPKLQNRLLKIAYDLRHLCDADNKHITFLIKGKRVVSLGTNNSFKTHPKGKELGYYANGIHSELHAYIKLRDKSLIPHLTVVNVRLSKTGKINLSKPCKCCEPFLKGLGFKRLYYTNEQGNFVKGWKNDFQTTTY